MDSHGHLHKINLEKIDMFIKVKDDYLGNFTKIFIEGECYYIFLPFEEVDKIHNDWLNYINSKNRPLSDTEKEEAKKRTANFEYTKR